VGAPVIDEVRFPEDIQRGVVGGAEFSTLIIVDPNNLTEQRQANWEQSRYSWDASRAAESVDQARTLVAFFNARRGRARGFRWKDWQDFTATDEPLYPDGSPTVQLVRTYSSGGVDYVRDIYKIVSSPAPTFRKNALAITPDDIDYNTGTILLPVVNQKSITSISQAASAVVGVGAAHGFATNDLVYFSGVAGMTEINGLVGTVTATGASTITVNIATTGFSAYTSGGLATKYLATTDDLDWTGEFDVPVRFDTDKIQLRQDDVLVRSWDAIPIVEIRRGTLAADLTPFAPSELTAELA
jgi:uncharacterized protein (TIGR02217 family)